MDLDYHIKLVNNPSSGYKRTQEDHLLVARAQALYPCARAAMAELVSTGDYSQYIQGISAYDQFIWTASHQGDKTNLFAYKKIKVSPTWTEQIWAPVFERVRRQVSSIWAQELVLVQNMAVVETVGTTAPAAYKDVDVGVGIKKVFGKKSVIMPVVVGENKTGHYCKTACTNVDGIIRRVLQMNSRVLAFCITDNNVSVGQAAEVDHVFGSGGVLIQQRGIGQNNNRKVNYPVLSPDHFRMVETLCVKRLSKLNPEDFLNIEGKATSGVHLRQCIDQRGFFVPKELESYL